MAAVVMVLLVGGSGLATAGSASAATGSVDCAALPNSIDNVARVAVAPGESLTLGVTNCNGGWTTKSTFWYTEATLHVTYVSDATGSCDGPFYGGGFGSDKTSQLVFRAPLTPKAEAAQFDLYDGGSKAVICTITVAESAAASGSSIPSWVQACGRTSQDASWLDGWDPSWQEWAQATTGASVCTRSIPSLG